MIAGLLGEHLTSPRTAQKTNQNTALEPKPARGNESSSKEDFASYVADDPSAVDTPRSRREDGPQDAYATPGTDSSASQTGDTRAEPIWEADAKPLPITITPPAPADNPLTGISEDAALANTPEIAPAMPSEATLSSAELLENARQFDPRVRAEVPGDAATSDLIADQDIKFNQGSSIEPALTENELKRLLTQTGDNETTTRPLNTEVDAEIDLGRLNTRADLVDGELTRINLPGETAEAQLRGAATTGLQTPGGDLASMLRDGAATGPDTILNVGPTTAPTASTVAATPGMTPVAPSIPVASPNELTGIIMNALQNGMDPQEQLIVQLDPPELGRIMIDFKFDAQGLQQITVTSENPEALKRLREMHAELTAALRDRGLAGDNLSFQQNTQDRPQTSWGALARSEQELVFAASDDRRARDSAGSREPGSITRTRLDLVL
jgi:hypothetical protein